MTTYRDLPTPVKKAYGKFTSACRPMHGLSVASTQRLAGELKAVAHAHGIDEKILLDLLSGQRASTQI